MGQTVTAAVVNLYNSSDFPHWQLIGQATTTTETFSFNPSNYTEVLIEFKNTDTVFYTSAIYPVEELIVDRQLRTQAFLSSTGISTDAACKYIGNNQIQVFIVGNMSFDSNRAILYAR